MCDCVPLPLPLPLPPHLKDSLALLWSSPLKILLLPPLPPERPWELKYAEGGANSESLSSRRSLTHWFHINSAQHIHTGSCIQGLTHCEHPLLVYVCGCTQLSMRNPRNSPVIKNQERGPFVWPNNLTVLSWQIFLLPIKLKVKYIPLLLMFRNCFDLCTVERYVLRLIQIAING